MERFTSTLFQILRQMDKEAVASAKGSPTGLSWYGGHFEPDKMRPRTEVCWSQRLAQLLPEHGYPARTEVPYPHHPRWRCDDVVTLPDGRRLWLENKGAWKDYWHQQCKLSIYRSYLLHPLVAGLDASKSHTVPLDIEKLAGLRSSEADCAAILLIGFDSDRAPMGEDVAQLIELARLDQVPWSTATDQWPDAYRTGCHVRCWLWWRPV